MARKAGILSRLGRSGSLAGPESKARRFRLAAIALIALAVAPLLAWVASNDANAEDSELQRPIELREERSGFAGVSLSLVTIQPDGTWSEDQYLIVEPDLGLDAQKRTRHREGVLSEETLQELSDQVDALQMPLSLGDVESAPHPHGEPQISVTYGPRTMLLAPGVQSSVSSVDLERGHALAEAIKRAVAEAGE